MIYLQIIKIKLILYSCRVFAEYYAQDMNDSVLHMNNYLIKDKPQATVLYHNRSSHQYAMPKLRFISIGLKASKHHQPIGDQDTKKHGSETSYPNMQSPNHRPGKLGMLSQHAMCTTKLIPACNQPITSQGSQTCYPSVQ